MISCLNTGFRTANKQSHTNYVLISKEQHWRSPANVSVNSNWVHLPPGKPREIFFERANPGYQGNFFCLNPLPRGKNDGRIPRGGAKFFRTRRNCSLSLQKILKKTTRQYKFFYLESLTKPLYFKLKQSLISNLDIQLRQ